ncbi:MAG TPA: prepilin-type N-terminal cleavage/methylation domain-containing protein [Candidatus Sulfotelmatobacter sp.]|nr:prepilin-type N-terminal cleavage/methylation domain-containing protein [Candidatus Sulfotelmatobacter sp.]
MYFRLPNRKQLNAFTLIELMVVCVLLVILASVILPEMRGSYQGSLLRATARKLLDTFDLAYNQAVSQDQVDRVRLDTRNNKYAVEKRVEDQGQENFEPLKDVPDAEGDLDSRISFEVRDASEGSTNAATEAPTAETVTRDAPNPAPDNVISFFPDGTADNREVILRDREGFGLALRVNPITARVKIVELPRQ